jgi:hypothetical protein
VRDTKDVRRNPAARWVRCAAQSELCRTQPCQPSKHPTQPSEQGIDLTGHDNPVDEPIGAAIENHHHRQRTVARFPFNAALDQLERAGRSPSLVLPDEDS